MAETQATEASEQATTIETAAPEISAPAPEVRDLQSYTDLVKLRLVEGQRETDGKPRDDKGRFQAQEKPAEKTPEGKTEAEPGDEDEAPQEEPDEVEEGKAEVEAKPEVPSRIEVLRKKVELERNKRIAEFETKKKLEQLEAHAPLIKGLAENKVSTLDGMLSDQEFEKLCDIRIARISGKQPPADQAQSNQVNERIEKKLSELEQRERNYQIQQAQSVYQKNVSQIASKAEGFEVARDYLFEKGHDFAQTCVETADEMGNLTGKIPSEQETIDTVIAWALGELETAEKVRSKRANLNPASDESGTVEKKESTQKKRKSINSSLSGSAPKHADIRVTGHESYAELIKAQIRAQK